jgi:long-chain acyl-CoA synthetase
MLARRADGSWEHSSSRAVGERVRALALGLRSLGYPRGEHIGLLSHTRMEWALADYAMVMAGLVNIPVYPNLPADQVAFVLQHSGARAAFVADQEQLDKVISVHGALPKLKRIIAFEPVQAPDELTGRLEILTLNQLAELGEAAEPELADSYERYARATKADDPATLIYTSGTTGDPKGVVLTHNNFYSNAVLTLRVFPILPGDRVLAILPLAHVFERTVGHYIMWHAGVSIAYAESTLTIIRDLGEAGPTIVAGVPRVFEKVLEGAVSKAREAGGLKWKIFRWARATGEAAAARKLAGESVGPWLGARVALADRLVFSRLRTLTGGKVRYFVSGGAPLNASVALFFYGAGLRVIEGYGLTETAPVLCFNPVDSPRLGTVGPPIPGVEIAIADDSEVLARGPQIMKGYYRNEEATRTAITDEGWFHTGDIGELDEAGYLKITDRKKELIITAYGKNILPQPVEEEIRRSPLVTQAVMLGDRRKFPIVVIVPEFGLVQEWAVGRGIEEREPAALLADARVREWIETEVLAGCAHFAQYEKPRRALVLPAEFTIESGELTPTLKVKRRIVEKNHRPAIEALYQEAEAKSRKLEDYGGRG